MKRGLPRMNIEFDAYKVKLNDVKRGGAGREHRPVTPRPAYQRVRIARRAPMAPPPPRPRTRPAALVTITQLKERKKAALLAGFYWQRWRRLCHLSY